MKVNSLARARRTAALSATLVSLWSAASFAFTADAARAFDIERQPLASALREFAQQSDLQILFSSNAVEAKHTDGIKGELAPEAALHRLLQGTGLNFRLRADRTILVDAPTSGETAHVPAASKPLRLAQAGGSDGYESVAQDRAAAESTKRSGIEEVVVTSRKREERLQNVPASIAAATGETIADLNITGVTELDAIAPGLTFVTNPSRFGSGPSIALRGVSTQTQSSGVQDSVGIVIDGVVIARAKPGSFPDLADTERVEIMRGPQGTLFGKNASAGVISITTKDPTPQFTTELALGYGLYDNTTVRGSVSGSLVDGRLLGRISGFSKSRDGYVENISDGSDWESDKQKGVRAKLVLLASTADEIKLNVDFTEQKNNGGVIVARSFTPTTPAYVIPYLEDIIGLENDEINAPSIGSNRHRTGGVSAEWNRSTDNHTFTAISAFRRFNQRYLSGTYGAYTPMEDVVQFGGHDLNQLSQELRLASKSGGAVDYVAGLFVLSDENEVSTQFPGFRNVVTGSVTGRNYRSDVDTLNYAAFAEVDVRPFERFTFTGGLRWTRETVDAEIIGYAIPAGQIRNGHPEGVTTDSASARNLSMTTACSMPQSPRDTRAPVSTSIRACWVRLSLSTRKPPGVTKSA
jgi:outer membrane receptor protein involved in Fe transport